jgi:hypothetical protein
MKNSEAPQTRIEELIEYYEELGFTHEEAIEAVEAEQSTK